MRTLLVMLVLTAGFSGTTLANEPPAPPSRPARANQACEDAFARARVFLPSSSDPAVLACRILASTGHLANPNKTPDRALLGCIDENGFRLGRPTPDFSVEDNADTVLITPALARSIVGACVEYSPPQRSHSRQRRSQRGSPALR